MVKSKSNDEQRWNAVWARLVARGVADILGEPAHHRSMIHPESLHDAYRGRNKRTAAAINSNNKLSWGGDE
jgi:hypothetical protein